MFYLSSVLTDANGYSSCHTHCATCTQTDVCDTCITTNSDPITIGCECKVKYYPSTTLTDANGCSSCHNHCSTCSAANVCETCITTNSDPTTIGCACKAK